MAEPLGELLIRSKEMSDGDVVYAIRPWSLNSDACVVKYQSDEIVVRLLSGTSFEYFLEAPLIKDILGQLEDAHKPTLEALKILLYYAENDAFP
jgi:hypothetical protein